MVELFSLKEMPNEAKIELLKELGYDSDGVYVLKDDKSYLDRYIAKPIKVDNMVILPGSTIILDDNPLSISSYFEEFGDVI